MNISIDYLSGRSATYYDVSNCFIDIEKGWFVMHSKSFRTHEKILPLPRIKAWYIRQ